MTKSPRKTKSYNTTIHLESPDGFDADAFDDYCKHVRRSSSWVLREALRLYLTTVEHRA